jgi:membrane fusion protein, multidrug efflux system
MNDMSRTTDFSVSHLALREPWWRQTGQRLRHSRVAAVMLALLTLVGLAALSWLLSHRNAANQSGANARFRAVATVGEAAAARADVPIYLDALGTVTPLATAVVQSQVSGVLTQVFYQEGQTVKKGDPLVQIDPRPFQIAFEQAQASAQRDEANLANQSVIVQRDRVLLKQDSIAQQQVDTDEATLKQLQAVVAADRAAADSARLNLSWSRVTAPITGRVGLRPVDVGNFITSGLANGVATITQVVPIDVQFALPAQDVPRVEQRLAAGAVLQAIALDQARTTQLGVGTFLTLDNQIDTQTGTIHAKARFGNENAALFPQQFVNVRLLLDTLEGATVVPSAAVREGPQGTYVYVISPDHVAHVRLVKTGPSEGDKISIASGLDIGEQVVTEGGDRLVDGAKVRLPSDIPAQGQGRQRRTAQTGSGSWRKQHQTG